MRQLGNAICCHTMSLIAYRQILIELINCNVWSRFLATRHQFTFNQIAILVGRLFVRIAKQQGGHRDRRLGALSSLAS